MHEQLRALWKAKSKEQAFVRGLLSKNTLNNCDDKLARNLQGEKWFALVGHTLFFCKESECADYAGALLMDVFSPIIARVNQKVLDAFQLPEAQQVGLTS